jgi:hypothetical protein
VLRTRHRQDPDAVQPSQAVLYGLSLRFVADATTTTITSGARPVSGRSAPGSARHLSRPGTGSGSSESAETVGRTTLK